MATGQSQVGQDDGVEKAKQQIRGLVGEIAEISKGDMLPEQYYAAFLQRVIQALAAVGGAIWTLGEGNAPQLAYQINLSPKLLDKESEDSQKHYRLLDYITSSNQSQLIPPMSSAGDERMGGNPTKQLLVVAPLGHDGQVYLRGLGETNEVRLDWGRSAGCVARFAWASLDARTDRIGPVTCTPDTEDIANAQR